MQQPTVKSIFLPLMCSLFFVLGEEGWAQDAAATESHETTSPLDDEGKLVQFERDIAPIFRAHCLECHGPEEAKNDFRIDDPEVLMDYIEPEDVQSSGMYVDYLTIDDEDMLMPPKSHGGPLTASQLALIRVWIEEGAHWPDGFELAATTAVSSDENVKPTPPEAPRSLSQRIWAAQGFLHPAVTHFPIAFFLLGGGFVVLGWKWPSVGTQIPLACLLLGACTAVAATLMGWSFAIQEGYGGSWNIFDWDREIDVHRWSGVIVAIVSSVCAIIALVALWKDSQTLTTVWKIGLLLCAGMVGAVGHQGGELNYGKDFYPKAFRILTGEPEQTRTPIESTADASL